MEFFMPPNRPYNVVPKKPPVQKQLDTIWNYLAETQQKLNRNITRSSPQAQCQLIANVIEKADKVKMLDPKVPYSDKIYASMKANIMKTADVIVRDSQTFSKTLAGTAAFRSEFGALFANATLKIDGTPVGIRQLYTWNENLKNEFGSYVTNSQQYIKDGLLGFDGASPIYGIEVGLLSESIEVTDNDGKLTVVKVSDPIKTRITASEWSLWRNDIKLCYTNENDIYFPSAHITGGSIKIGDHFSVDNAGNMIAKSGQIAGWTIKNDVIFAENNGVRFQLASGDSSDSWIYSRASDGSYPFYVLKDGTLYATGANISGRITAKSGFIAGWVIGENVLSTSNDHFSVNFYAPTVKGNASVSNASFINIYDKDSQSWPFYVTSDGTLYATKATIKGNITAPTGSIANWTIDTNRIYSTNSNNATFQLSGGDNSDSWIWVRKSDGSYPFYVLKDGTLYATGATISGKITATSGTIGNWHIQSNHLSGYIDENNYVTIWAPSSSNHDSFINLKHNGAYTFYVEANGHLYASNATIKGTIEAGTIISNGCYIGSYIKVDQSSNTVKLFHKDSTGNHIGLSPTWAELACENTSVYVTTSKGTLAGTWTTNDGIAVTSDANKKNSISVIDSRYDALYDNLIPSIFKYNKGTSNRYHSGFVAQQFYDAVIKAGLTTQDLAAVCYDTNEQGEKVNWAIRYSEIIALNTWQIQKLKARIKELESQIKQLQLIS